MTIRRASVILPSGSSGDFPSHLQGQAAAELLGAVTALWHPSLIHVTRELPGTFGAEELPDPIEIEGQLIAVPSASRERMPPEWLDRLTGTAPKNPPPVMAGPIRSETVSALLAAASIDAGQVRGESVADFLALGHAYLQVEQITRALRYTSVLDSDQFTTAVLTAADAAVSGNRSVEQEELGRAFDLLADARNHVYSVDFYVIDVTLVTDSTLGEVLRAKLAAGSPTNLLITGAQLDRMASQHPETLAELKRAIEAETTSIVGGFYGGVAFDQSPESLLSGLKAGQEAARRHLGREYEVFGQFDSDFSPLLPGVLKNLGFRGALHAAFDGGGLPRADQRKTNWGEEGPSSIEALSAVPLDVSRPETWLKLAERIGDSIAHDHVATILLAGWPGTETEYFDDLRHAARYGSVLGKLVTLDAYFRESREADEWTKFNPREYANRTGTDFGANPISTRVDAYRGSAGDAQRKLADGFAAIAGFAPATNAGEANPNFVVINPWSVASTHIVGGNLLRRENADDSIGADGATRKEPLYFPDIPGCGFAAFESAAMPPRVALVEKLQLRNEWLELTVSEKTGGIQSLRRHSDRTTRVSQRLVFHHLIGETPPETRMVADKIEVTRNEPLVGEITSRGRIFDAGREVLAGYVQRVRVIRGLPAVIVDIELDPKHLPNGNIWKSYFASRLAWADEAIGFRRGRNWCGRETTRECIESLEWVEIDDGIGAITCYALGLPFHRIPALARLDSLLLVAGEERRRFQFALSIDRNYPTHAALALLSAAEPDVCHAASPLSTPTGWFLHVGAKNVLCTHVEPLQTENGGMRMRLLETEGRHTQTTVAAFRPFQSAWITDFRGNRSDVLSVSEGRAEIDFNPYSWMQIEAEW
jgi:alpha-mannosidase